MISLIRKIFIDNWQRKLLAFFLAFIVWFFVYNSLTVTKTVPNVSIKIINLPNDKTIKGMKNDGLLEETIPLTITGISSSIEKISNKDLQVVIDLKDKNEVSFEENISKQNLVSLNNNIKIDRCIKKIDNQKVFIHVSNLMKNKIPVLISEPIGESPKSYQYIDIWPYKLYLTVSGPEEIVKDLKSKGIKLVLDLHSISEKELDSIDSTKKRGTRDIITYYVPNSFKKIFIPSLSATPFEIDDPNAKSLRIDFIKKDFIPINSPIHVELFFPPKTSEKFNPKTVTIANNEFIKKVNNLNIINIPLYAMGVTQSFLDSVKDRLYIVIIVQPKEEKEFLEWGLQAALPYKLDDAYIKNFYAEESENFSSEIISDENLKYQFRSFWKKFRLWQSPKQKLKLKITLENNQVVISPQE